MLRVESETTMEIEAEKQVSLTESTSADLNTPESCSFHPPGPVQHALMALYTSRSLTSNDVADLLAREDLLNLEESQ